MLFFYTLLVFWHSREGNWLLYSNFSTGNGIVAEWLWLFFRNIKIFHKLPKLQHNRTSWLPFMTSNGRYRSIIHRFALYSCRSTAKVKTTNFYGYSLLHSGLFHGQSRAPLSVFAKLWSVNKDTVTSTHLECYRIVKIDRVPEKICAGFLNIISKIRKLLCIPPRAIDFLFLLLFKRPSTAFACFPAASTLFPRYASRKLKSSKVTSSPVALPGFFSFCCSFPSK